MFAKDCVGLWPTRGLASKLGLGLLLAAVAATGTAQENKLTRKPALHGSHWVAVAGKPLAAEAGAKIFERGGNAVDAACAMLAAAATMWDTLGWGGETQALIYNPHTHEVKGIDALGVAPTGATPDYFRSQGMSEPPDYGPLAAVTPGTPGGLMIMLAEFGTMHLADVLEPALEMTQGYPVESQAARSIEAGKELLRQWPGSRRVLLVHDDPDHPDAWSGPLPGEVFKQPELRATLMKLVEAERKALDAGKSRKDAIMAAYNRFYRGDIAEEIARGTQEEGGLITKEDLANYHVYVENAVTTRYKDVDVYKLTTWVQSPVLLQTLNILENVDLQAMGYNSVRYIHTIYQAMNLAYADRDFYYGDPYFPPKEPIKGLLSKAYAKERYKQIDWHRNDPTVGPGDPYPYQGETNPYKDLLRNWQPQLRHEHRIAANEPVVRTLTDDQAFHAGTTSLEAADAEGWVVSMTPSGGWMPAFIPGKTGIGLSERMQSFVMDPSTNPFNVLEPGKRPRATLSPTIALRNGKPYLAFAVQGGDSQDQNLLQFFLDMRLFGMNVQQATEAANFNSYQMMSSFGTHEAQPGRLLVRADMPKWAVNELEQMGYDVETAAETSGPITAIYFDQLHDTLWGGASDFGDDYGIAW